MPPILKGPFKENWDMEFCLPPYKVFLKFARNLIVTKEVGLEKILGDWEAFWARYKSAELYAEFIELFQHIQVKGYSEAVCETVG